MDKFIIKLSGKMPDILTALKTLKTIYGGGVTLSDVDKITRYNQLKITIEKQFKKEV